MQSVAAAGTEFLFPDDRIVAMMLRRTSLTGSILLAAIAADASFGQEPTEFIPSGSQLNARTAVVRYAQPEALYAPQPPAELPPLDLAELQQQAVISNPSVARAEALVQAACGRMIQAGLKPNPHAGYLGSQLGSGGQAEQHGVIVMQDFVRGGKLRLNQAVAQQEMIMAEQRLAAQQQRVMTDVRVKYYEVLIAQQRLNRTTELSRVAGDALKAVNQLFEAQESAKVDVLQSKLESQQAELQQIAARNRLAAAWRELIAVCNLPIDESRPVIGRPDELAPLQTFEETLARLLAHSPQVSEAMSNIERARWALARAQAEPIGDVNVQAVVMQDNGIGGKTDGILQMTMPIPLYNKNQGAILAAQRELTAATYRLEQLEVQLSQKLAGVYERYTTSREQVERYRDELLPAAAESLELSKAGYGAGEFSFLSLLTAQRTLVQTNLGYLEALRELQTSAAEIDGLLLNSSLDTDFE